MVANTRSNSRLPQGDDHGVDTASNGDVEMEDEDENKEDNRTCEHVSSAIANRSK